MVPISDNVHDSEDPGECKRVPAKAFTHKGYHMCVLVPEPYIVIKHSFVVGELH